MCCPRLTLTVPTRPGHLLLQAIAINQAWAGHPGRLVWSGIDPYYSVVAKPLGGGAMAVLVVSKNGNGDMTVTFPLELFGLDSTGAVGGYAVRDVWGRRDLGVVAAHTGNWTVDHLSAHDSAFLKFTPQK